ncbi:MAG: hydrogenase expression/formation protein HypE [Parvularculaceae bacterium]
MSVFDDKHVTLAHGNGGRFMNALIDEIFARHFESPEFDPQLDAAPLQLDPGAEILMTTDGFIVQPLEFPGGDIGSLAVHGTVNDLAVSGARPRYLTLSAIIEEGLELRLLDRIAASAAAAAKEAGVRIIAGDTKVTPRGSGGGLYLTTAGVGEKPRNVCLGMRFIKPGDAVLVSGPVGDHGVAVMLAREDFDLKGDIRSDSANVIALTQALLPLGGLCFMRDPTRGGLATVACEIAAATGRQVRLYESAIPVRPAVSSVCDILGYDPYYLACEGRVVAIVEREISDEALARWQALPEGEKAAIIGEVRDGAAHAVLETEIGGERILEELEDDPLPRIC